MYLFFSIHAFLLKDSLINEFIVLLFRVHLSKSCERFGISVHKNQQFANDCKRAFQDPAQTSVLPAYAVNKLIRFVTLLRKLGIEVV